MTSKKKIEKVDPFKSLYVESEYNPNAVIDAFLPPDKKEEYLLLTAIPENNRDDYIIDRIAELENIINENIQTIGYENTEYSEMKIMEEENNITLDEKKEKTELTPLNVNFNKNAGIKVKNFNKEELLSLMISMGFKNLDGYTTGMLRRIWLAYNYDQFFWDVHYKTNLPISIIYAYFIMEATIEGVESNLMAKYMNPGGIKYRGIGPKTKAYDDCYNRKGKRIKCDFAVFYNYDDMVNGWANVFNQNRYSKCNTFKTAGQICKCLYKSGYHTANNWEKRANLSREYWKLRISFP